MSILIEVKKNGATLHHKEVADVATALRQGQALANACNITVRVIDTDRADGLTLIRPIR